VYREISADLQFLMDFYYVFDYFNQDFQLVRNLKRKRKKELGLILKEHTELQIDRCGGKHLQLEWKPRERWMLIVD
jgi:hypothetical protein